MLTVATWNVNSLRARLEHVLRWIDMRRPDIVALQEIKLFKDFPAQPFEERGYTVVFSGEKSYNGVAFLYKSALHAHVAEAETVQHLPGNPEDTAKRLLAMRFGQVRLINVYMPNGGAGESDSKFHYKCGWLQRFSQWLGEELQQHPYLLVLGDFNIAPADQDVHAPERWTDSALTHHTVRAHFSDWQAMGLWDGWRAQEPAVPGYTWWDYRLQAFRRNWGLRIDHILISEQLRSARPVWSVDTEPRTWEKPSDHVPVSCTFSEGFPGF